MMRRVSIHSGGWRFLLAGLALLMSSPSTRFAAASEPPVAYRRVLVPAESPATWPRGDKAYIPVEASDFNNWIAAANAPPAEAAIVTAEYRARLDDERLAGGTGRWHIELRGDRPTLLRVGETSLRINGARWRGAGDTPARLGWWPTGPGEPLVYALEVPRSGELEFNWSVAPTKSGTSTINNPLRLPTAARTRLALELPAGKRPTIDGGVVLQSPSSPDAGGRWLLALGESAEHVLRVESDDPQTPSSKFAASVAEEVRYTASQRGMVLSAKLDIGVVDDGLRVLDITLPKSFRLVTAAADGHELKWHVTEAATAGGAPHTLIELPASRSSRNLTIELEAWGSLVCDDRMRLPSIAVDKCLWQSAVIIVTLDEALELREVNPVDCTQIAVASGEPAQDMRRQLSFAAHAPSAAVQLTLAHRAAVGHAQLGTSAEVGGSGVSARHVARVRIDQGRLSRLTALLRPGWSIDAVETIPANALGEWYLAQAGDARLIELRLNRAIAAQHGVTVVVTGRLPRMASLEPLTLAELSPLDWRGLSVDRQLLQLRAGEQRETETVGELAEIAADTLTSAERKLFAQPAAGRLYDLAASSERAAIRLAPNKGDYEATVQLGAALNHGRLQQLYHIQCRPLGSGIDHLLVYLTQPVSQPLRWIDADSREPVVAERMPDDDPRLGGLPPGGELWQLHLSQPYARPLNLATSWSEPWPQRRRVPLISLPDARAQQGRAVISSGGEMPTIVARGMSPAPLPVDSSDGLAGDAAAMIRAVYRFQPTRLYDGEPAPELWLGPVEAEQDGARLVAAEVEIESRYAQDGAGAHRVTYHFENQGAPEIKFSLPDGIALAAARIDGHAVTCPQRGAISIPLPSRQVQPVLQLELASRPMALASGGRLSAPLPLANWTTLAGRWTIELPNGYAAIDESDAAARAAFDWRVRLFGPLARPAGTHIFNPLSAADWNALWVALSSPFAATAKAADISPPEEPPLPDPWHTYEFGFAVVPPAKIVVVHQPAIAAGALAVCLVCAAGASLVGPRSRTLVVWAAIAAAIALVVPTVLAPLATAAGLGFAAAALWRWWQQQIALRKSVLTVGVAAVALVSTIAHASEPPPAMEQVFVPVDAKGEVAGTKYFVSADFLRRLVGSASAQSSNPAWLVRDMRCDGELVQRQQDSQVRVGHWVVTFEIETFARDTTVRLPLVKSEADWPETASLDGMPAPVTWDAAGHECALRVAEPGRCRLSLPFEPRVTQVAGRPQVELNLPQVVGTEVRIVTPARFATLQGLGTTFARYDEQNRTVWRCEPDSLGRLRLSWLPDRAGSLTTGGHGIDELLWMHLRPEGVTLDVRLALRGGGEWPESVALAVDHDWEIVGGDVAELEGSDDELPDGRRLCYLRAAAAPSAAADKNRQISLSLRARSSTSLGRWRVPDISLVFVEADSCWLAVSCDPALDCAPSAAPTAAAGPVSSFTDVWGAGDDSVPQLFLNTAGLEAAWYVAVKPRGDISSCRDLLSLAAGTDRLRVDYRSDISPEGADRFGWSLDVPAALVVEDVAVTCDERTVALDAVRVAPNRLNLFLAEELRQPYQLQLRGSLPAEPDGNWPLPRIFPAGSQQTTQTVALYRDPDVLATWRFSGEVPWIESGASQDAPFGPATQFVRGYAIESLTTGEVQIHVEPNASVVQGDTLTTLACDQGVWTATYRCDLRVEDGELDTLRWEIPANWIGPFQASPTGQLPTVTRPAAGQAAQLTLRLRQPARRGDVVQLQFESPLTLVEGVPPAAPRIVLLSPGRRQDFLALPAQLDGKPTEWTRGGIEPADLPRRLRADASDAQDAVTYRLVADAIDVTLRQRPIQTAEARIPLVETAVRCGAADGMCAVTRFFITPEGLDQCVIELDANDRLVRASLDGQPALMRSLDERHWQVQLGPPNLPQVLDVVTRAAGESRSWPGQIELRRPLLKRSGQPIPVDLNLWSVDSLGQEGTPQVAGGATIAAADFATARLEQLTSISQNSTRSVLETPPVDGRSWFLRWTERLAAARRAAEKLQRSPAAARDATQVPQPADTTFAELNARCDSWNDQVAKVLAANEADITRTGPPTKNLLDPWLDVTGDPKRQICLVSDGDLNRVSVELVPDGLSPSAARLAVLMALACVAGGAVWLLRNPPVVHHAQRWPEVVGVVLGLVAWVWLWPSAAGLALAVVCLFFVARRIAWERKSPGHGSSNQPISIPEDAAKP